MGFDLFPKTYKDVFTLKEYTAWYHMLWIAPVLLAMMLYWDIVVKPWRKLRG